MDCSEVTLQIGRGMTMNGTMKLHLRCAVPRSRFVRPRGYLFVVGLSAILPILVPGAADAQSTLALTPGTAAVYAGHSGTVGDAIGTYSPTTFNNTATITTPMDVAVDPTGNVYWVEPAYPTTNCTTACSNGNVVRMGTADGTTVGTIIGGQQASPTARPGFSGDGGAATSAILNNPRGLKFSPAGDLEPA